MWHDILIDSANPLLAKNHHGIHYILVYNTLYAQ